MPRRLLPVSVFPEIHFPTDQIFQIEQCLEPFTSVGKGKNRVDSLVLENVPSSVITGEDEEHVCNVDLEAEAEANRVKRMADVVRLPIDEKIAKLLSFNEVLVVSRMDGAAAAVDEEDKEVLSAVRSGPKLHPLLKVDRLVPMGGMAINVQTINDKFIINSSTQFSFEGSDTASATIQAEYSNSLEMEYEKRCETLSSRSGKSVRK